MDIRKTAYLSGLLLGVLTSLSGCLIETREPYHEGHYDRDHHRYWHEHSWHDCDDREDRCR